MSTELLFCKPVEPRLIRIDVRHVENVNAYFTVSWKGCADARHRIRFIIRAGHWASLIEALAETPDYVNEIYKAALATEHPCRCWLWPTMAGF